MGKLSTLLFIATSLLTVSKSARAGSPTFFAHNIITGTPPTYIQEAETAWNTLTTPKTTASFNVKAGDLLVAYAVSESSGATLGISGGSLTWIQRQAVTTTNYSAVTIWTAVVDTNKSMTVSFTCSGTQQFGGNVLTFRGSAGVGAISATTGASGAPSLGITTLDNASTVVMASGDWSAINGSSRVWRMGATESSYSYTSGQYTAYGGFRENIGLAGSYTVGLSAPSGQKYSIVAVEVRGTGGQDPCIGTPPFGTPCNGGTIYAGTFQGGKYMTTPGGCTDSATPVCAGGTDTLKKTWNSGSSNWYDIPSISNVGADNVPSPTSERGNITTPLIAAITLSGQGGVHAAAKYCQDMVYGGYSDWYLPSKSEMEYIYCNSREFDGMDGTAPPEDFGCASNGGKKEYLQDVVRGDYWTSTEGDSTNAWRQWMGNGYQFFTNKNVAYYVRCVRRY